MKMKAVSVDRKSKSLHGGSAKRYKQKANRKFRRKLKSKLKAGEWDAHIPPCLTGWDLV